MIKNIYYNENEIYPEILDIEHEAANLYLERIWTNYLNKLWVLDKLFCNTLPSWFIHKDSGGIFLHKNRLSDRPEVYVFDPDTNTFDVLFAFGWLIPLFFLEAGYSAWFELYYGCVYLQFKIYLYLLKYIL